MKLLTERQRGHIKQWNIYDVAGEDTTLDRSTDSNILARVNSLGSWLKIFLTVSDT